MSGCRTSTHTKGSPPPPATRHPPQNKIAKDKVNANQMPKQARPVHPDHFPEVCGLEVPPRSDLRALSRTGMKCTLGARLVTRAPEVTGHAGDVSKTNKELKFCKKASSSSVGERSWR